MIYRNKMAFIALLTLFLSACCGGDIALTKTDEFITNQKIDKTQTDWKTTLNKPPLLTFTPNMNYFWELKTSQGDLSIKLFTDSAPMHVSSTIYLTKLGFYDGLTFHRVIPDFMAQGGDPLGTGTGNPGYKYQGEFDNDKGHKNYGTVSMANSGPGTDGSQFFITFKPTPFLNGRHTVFGEVLPDVAGTLAKIEGLGSRRGKTKEPITILKASIRVAKKR